MRMANTLAWEYSSSCSEKSKACVGWINDYFNDCVCSVSGEISFALGIISLLCWGAAEVPQLITNFLTKSAHGVSLTLLLTWVIGDIFNLVGCLLEPVTLPTQLYTALLYTATTVVLVLQTLYYDCWPMKCWKSKGLRSTDPQVEEEEDIYKTPLINPKLVDFSSAGTPISATRTDAYYTSARSLASSGTPSSTSYLGVRSGPSAFHDLSTSEEDEGSPTHHRRHLRGSAPRKKTTTTAMSRSVSYGTFAASLAGLPFQTKAFSDVQMQLLATLQGLNPLMFIFALIANATYVGSILVRSVEWERLKANAPWLLDAIVCILLDLFPRAFSYSSASGFRTMAAEGVELPPIGAAGKGGKGRRLWKKVRYQLVEYHSLPGYLKDNEYILGYYRSEWPLKQTLLSIFTIHNETLNVWTHLIGFFLFLALTIYTAMKVPTVVDLHSLQHLPDVLRKADLQKLQSELVACLPSLPHLSDLQRLKVELKTSFASLDMLPSLSHRHLIQLLSYCLPHRFTHANYTNLSLLSTMKDDVANMIAPLLVRPISRWPFFAFLGGAMFCLLASSTCHLLSCHSRRLAYIMLRLDYAGIAALIATSFYPPVYYSFMCNPFFCNMYLGFITILGIATVAVSLIPVFQSPEFRSIRAGLFFGMGLSGIVPVLHKLVIFWHRPEALHTTGYEVLMGLLYGLGALVYATRIPERWMPGKFDIAGHSHQLFHVLVVAGAYTHYQAGLVYLKWRDMEGC
ncbi:hypothetical protein Cni_G04309 [Canna indica]|uniref:Heptahelical transmembrane protein 4 n=1 Tax=Canna indica TaxID=4628 RepID=A0AAQ3Q4C9_9LILI|nr:hypothetical protein Cni_G04309 [Canna indica]